MSLDYRKTKYHSDAQRVRDGEMSFLEYCTLSQSASSRINAWRGDKINPNRRLADVIPFPSKQ